MCEAGFYKSFFSFRSDPMILELLIAKGAQLDSRDHIGRTALHFAVNLEGSECLRLLIHHGCDINIQVISS